MSSTATTATATTAAVATATAGTATTATAGTAATATAAATASATASTTAPASTTTTTASTTVTAVIQASCSLSCVCRLEGLDSNAYEAFQASRNLRDVVDRVAHHNTSGGQLQVRAALMTPVLPMLAEACKSVGYAMKKVRRCIRIDD